MLFYLCRQIVKKMESSLMTCWLGGINKWSGHGIENKWPETWILNYCWTSLMNVPIHLLAFGLIGTFVHWLSQQIYSIIPINWLKCFLQTYNLVLHFVYINVTDDVNQRMAISMCQLMAYFFLTILLILMSTIFYQDPIFLIEN